MSTISRTLLALLALTSALACGEPKPPLANEVTMTVTDKGFEPQNLRVEKGKPVTLHITRTSAATCATEIVVDDPKINTPLPLNQAVTVSFTPQRTGELKYGCAMQKMIGGVISVE
jgi:plastocyanin domain-containing protein